MPGGISAGDHLLVSRASSHFPEAHSSTDANCRLAIPFWTNLRNGRRSIYRVRISGLNLGMAPRTRLVPVLCAAFLLCKLAVAASSLDQSALKMLHDPGGWEYVAVLNLDNGMHITATCFVAGQLRPEDCRGTLKFTPDGDFVQNIQIHGENVRRHGAYELDGDQITFRDELGTQDGPYQLQVNTKTKTMRISMRQAGVLVGADFHLESDYGKKDRKK